MSEPVSTLARLKRRAEFVHVARGRRVHLPALTLQAARRPEGGAMIGMARIGFTVTKKVGNAVVRNRIRRRLREAVRRCETLSTEPETDYVVIARRDALTIRFERLVGELDEALRRSVHRGGPRKNRAVRPAASPEAL